MARSGTEPTAWFIQLPDREFGPYALETVRSLVARGEVDAGAFVRQGDTWLELAAFRRQWCETAAVVRHPAAVDEGRSPDDTPVQKTPPPAPTHAVSRTSEPQRGATTIPPPSKPARPAPEPVRPPKGPVEPRTARPPTKAEEPTDETGGTSGGNRVAPPGLESVPTDDETIGEDVLDVDEPSQTPVHETDGEPIDSAASDPDKTEALRKIEMTARRGDEPSESTAASAAAPAGAFARNTIVFLGRQNAGKTIYLATLYDQLWRGDGLRMKGIGGPTHRDLQAVLFTLRGGNWPAATIEAPRQFAIELVHGGRTRYVNALDYSGEFINKAFIDEDTSLRGVTELLHQLSHAAAVIILMDPEVAVRGSNEAKMQDDFGMVNAVRYIRQAPGGEEIPIVLVLTKADRNRRLIKEYGTPGCFVMKRYGPLLREMHQLTVYHVSAWQDLIGPDGRPVCDKKGKPLPDPKSTPKNVDLPLRYCLNWMLEHDLAEEAKGRFPWMAVILSTLLVVVFTGLVIVLMYYSG